MVLEDVLHAHPISEQRMKEVLGHTPLQARAQPAAAAWDAPKTREARASCVHTDREAVRMNALHVQAARKHDQLACT